MTRIVNDFSADSPDAQVRNRRFRKAFVVGPRHQRMPERIPEASQHVIG
ncbi:hypothetical protein MOQ72_10535 [Saccharopolyspora sp. K220]|nr:hypothetical protein [Saccharopolyspora soli]MCI2417860.1 hypothetical protein [Saccharopolyspora soli]